MWCWFWNNERDLNSELSVNCETRPSRNRQIPQTKIANQDHHSGEQTAAKNNRISRTWRLFFPGRSDGWWPIFGLKYDFQRSQNASHINYELSILIILNIISVMLNISNKVINSNHFIIYVNFHSICNYTILNVILLHISFDRSSYF